jgi:hypothetical protein
MCDDGLARTRPMTLGEGGTLHLVHHSVDGRAVRLVVQFTLGPVDVYHLRMAWAESLLTHVPLVASAVESARNKPAAQQKLKKIYVIRK